MAKYFVIKENQKMRTLLSIIRSHYISSTKESSIQEVNLEHVLNRVEDKDIRVLVKNSWKDLELLVNHEIRLLQKTKKTVLRKLRKVNDLKFIVKSDDPNIPMINSHNVSFKIEHKEINI